MLITLKVCNDSEEWDQIVERSSYGTLFHTWKFLRIIEKHTASKLYPLIGLKGETVVGIYPLFLQKKAFLKMVFSPPPHSAILYLGPILVECSKIKPSKKESMHIGFQKSVDDFILSELSANYVSVATAPGLSDSRPLKWSGYNVKPMYSYLLDLSKGEEYLWKQLTKNLRQNINKTKRKNVSIEKGSRKDLETIYELLTDRYNKQMKTVTVPKEYLFDIYDNFQENIKIFVARYDGEIITGGIDVWYKDKIISWIGSPKTSLKGISPNDLLFWETLKQGCESGFKQYEIIGTAGSERLHSYYSKCNPELLLWFSAVKYSSFVPRVLETCYIRALKPVYSRFKLIV